MERRRLLPENVEALSVRRRLPAGDAFFQEIRMLEPGEFDREAVIKVTHDTALHLAKRHKGADGGAVLGCNRSAGERQVDQAATDIDPIR